MTCIIFGVFNIPILSAVYSGIVALLFAMFLVFDTQMIIGGNKHEIDPEDYIYGAVSLYVDVVYIFLALLGMEGD